MPLFLAALTVLIACYTAYWRIRFRNCKGSNRRSTRAGNKLEAREGNDGNERRARAGNDGTEKRKVLFTLPITPFDPAFLNNYLKYPQKLIANDWGRSSSLNVNIEEMID